MADHRPTLDIFDALSHEEMRLRLYLREGILHRHTDTGLGKAAKPLQVGRRTAKLHGVR